MWKQLSRVENWYINYRNSLSNKNKKHFMKMAYKNEHDIYSKVEKAVISTSEML